MEQENQNPRNQKIVLPYNFEPRDYQTPLLAARDDGYDRLIALWHRRAGKEKTVVNMFPREMLKRVGSYYYFFPTYSQGEKVLWRGMDKNGFRFMAHFPGFLGPKYPSGIVKRVDNSKMQIELINGSLFQIIGTDNIDSVVGTNPIGCAFSEYSLQDPAAWDYIRPILAENDGWAAFDYTPRGKNHGYNLLQVAEANPHIWYVSKLTVDDTQAIKPEVLEQERIEIIQKNGDDTLFRQEYYIEFTAAILGAYYSAEYEQMERDMRITSVPYQPGALVHTVWDLGIDNNTVIGFFQGVGSERHMIDYIKARDKGLAWYIAQVLNKPYVYGKHFGPHDIRNKELGTGKTRWETAKELGLEFTPVPKMSLEDGIEAVRLLFPKLWVDKVRCAPFLTAIPEYHHKYDEKRKIFLDYPEHDWTSDDADMIRYAAIIEDQMTNDYSRNDYVQPDIEYDEFGIPRSSEA